MVRTENQKKSQKEWRLRNRAKCNAINLASRKRRYNEVGKILTPSTLVVYTPGSNKSTTLFT